MNEKLFLLRRFLLNEAADFDNGNIILTAMQRGQISGASYKSFNISDKTNEEKFKNKIDNDLLPIVKDKMPNKTDLNRYVSLFLKKANNLSTFLSLSRRDIDQIMDSFIAYFGNINKEQAKALVREFFLYYDMLSNYTGITEKEFFDFIDKTYD